MVGFLVIRTENSIFYAYVPRLCNYFSNNSYKVTTTTLTAILVFLKKLAIKNHT